MSELPPAPDNLTSEEKTARDSAVAAGNKAIEAIEDANIAQGEAESASDTLDQLIDEVTAAGFGSYGSIPKSKAEDIQYVAIILNMADDDLAAGVAMLEGIDGVDPGSRAPGYDLAKEDFKVAKIEADLATSKFKKIAKSAVNAHAALLSAYDEWLNTQEEEEEEGTGEEEI